MNYSYIEEIKNLDLKEGKAKLAEYGLTFGVKLNKQKSIENMIVDLENHIKENKSETSDTVIDTKVETSDLESVLDKPTESIIVNKETAPSVSDTPIFKEPVVSTFNVDEYSPTITLIGSGRGFYTLPWWLYDWICKNPDWKSQPDSIPYSNSLDIIKSLIYYINRDGSVMIRETRNSRFVELK